jgi:hypothetical protein
MRKIDRKELIFRVYDLWKANPDNDIRLAEFFVKAMENGPKPTRRDIDDLRFIEDDELLEALEQYNASLS